MPFTEDSEYPKEFQREQEGQTEENKGAERGEKATKPRKVTQQRRGPAKKALETRGEGREKIYLLITGDNAHEVVEEAGLEAAGARVKLDPNLRLVEGTLMDPKITF
jgi:hypothetical protein